MNTQTLIEKDDFTGLLGLLFSTKDKDVSIQVAEALAEVIHNPQRGADTVSWGELVAKKHGRLDVCLKFDQDPIADVMIFLSEKTLGDFREHDAVTYVIRHGKAEKLYQHITAKDPEYWRDCAVEGRDASLSNALFIDWIVGSGNLPDLYERIDRGEFWPWEVGLIYGTLLTLTVLDSVVASDYSAPSGITGDSNLALEVLTRINNIGYSNGTDGGGFNFAQTFVSVPGGSGVFSIENALVDLLSHKCSEDVICNAMIQSSAFSSISLLSTVLKKIGTVKSVPLLGSIPPDIPPVQEGGYKPHGTSGDLAGIVIRHICYDLDQTTLEQMLNDTTSDLVKEELTSLLTKET